MTVFGLILAGGQSRRMGGSDKAAMQLGGEAMLARAADRLSPQVARLAINAPQLPPECADYAHAPDTVPGFVGPLAGVLAGMQWAAQAGATHIATAATDTPFAPEDWVAEASAQAGSGIAMMHSNGRIHPVFALWPVRLADALHNFLTVENERKILLFARRHGVTEIDRALVNGLDPFFNVNTPEDLAIARERLS